MDVNPAVSIKFEFLDILKPKTIENLLSMKNDKPSIAHFFGLMAGISALLPGSLAASGIAKPFNVLFIAVDDLRPELGCYGNTVIQSPNIDALAAEGIVFQRAYCQQAICMASRASLLSGMLPEKRSIYACGPVNEAYPRHEKLDDLFRRSGYQVKAYGKIYHHGSDHRDQFGTDWIPGDPAGKAVGRGYLDPASIARIIDDSGRGPAFEKPDVEDRAYDDGFFAEEAVKTLDAFAQAGKPFFLAVGFHKPHLPFNAPLKYWDMYDEKNLQLPSNQHLPENYGKFTVYNFGELRNYEGMPKGKELIPEPLQRTLKHGYYACVSYMDAQLGKIMDKLKETGLDKNTIVILWGDHGWKLGEHGMWCKHTNFELDTRVPLIMKVPGYAAGKTSSFTELMDIYPTLAELCGIGLKAPVDGQSLVPVLNQPSAIHRTEAFSLYPYSRQDPKRLVIGYAVVNDRYRYIRWVNVSGGKFEEAELYDHQTDPGENVNLAGQEKYLAVEEELARLLQRKWTMNATILE